MKMRSNNFYTPLLTFVICTLLFVVGCGPNQADLSLKFTPQDSTTYKVTAEAMDSINFIGVHSDIKQFEDAVNHIKAQITFEQKIESINDTGDAIANITIKELMYSFILKNKPVIHFDSSNKTDPENPLSKLIGQSYKIQISTTGDFVKLLDVDQARKLVKGTAPANKAAHKILSNTAIQIRHGAFTLPDADILPLKIDDKWANTKTFNFRMLGSKSFEKIYTVTDIKKSNNKTIALVQMDTIPTTENAEELHKEGQDDAISEMFDNTETYSGQLRMNVTTGKIEEYSEKLTSDWFIVDPSANEINDDDPAALKMSAIRTYKLEKID